MPTVQFEETSVACDEGAVLRDVLLDAGVSPHFPDDGLRLACQTRVEGDLEVTKHEGFWGQHVAGDEPGD